MRCAACRGVTLV
ncbi:hypothetical protein JJE73_15475 [Comamonas sp. JC664]|nr:hypothetical protein [Comamonas sp. JC664]